MAEPHWTDSNEMKVNIFVVIVVDSLLLFIIRIAIDGIYDVLMLATQHFF